MKTLSINFAPPSLRRSLRQIHPLAWLVLLLALLLALATLLNAQTLRQQQQEIASDLQAKQNRLQQRQPVAVKIARPPVPEPQANAVNTAISQLNLPWRDLLSALEAGTPKTIALLSIEPDARKQTLKGVAEAKDSDAMLDFISQLKQQDFFDQVWLSKHETVEQDPNRPLRFQFEAHWEGAQP